MKKLVLSLMAAVALMFVPQALTAVNFVQYLATYGNSLTVGTDTLGGVTYSTVRYGDLYNGGEPGMPSLPIDYIRFSVPYNATNFTVTASSTRWTNTNLGHLLYPCQSPWFPDESGTPPPVTLPDTAAYFSGVSYPSQMAWVVDEGFLAGENHIVTVAVMPFRYTHTSTSDEVRKCRNLNVRLNYELSDTLALYPIVRNDSTLREEGYQLAQSMVVNPNQVKTYSFSYSNPDSNIQPDPINPGGPMNPNGGLGGDGLNFYGDPGEIIFDPDTTQSHFGGELEEDPHYSYYPYLIITTSDLEHSVRRIAALKRQKGYNVKVATLDEVYNGHLYCPGDVIGKGNNAHITYTDSAGRLRQYIRFHFENYETKYVLLAGSEIPYRTTTFYNILEDDSITVQSDLYFSDLNADWSDNNYDRNPELFVGRILAKTHNQIMNYTDKLYRYEINPGKGDYNYLNQSFYSQGYDMRINNEIYTIRSALDSIYPNPYIMEETNYYSEPISFPSGRDIVNELNSTHYSFISLHHHGYPSSLLTCGFRKNNHKSGYRFLWAIDTDTIAPTKWRDDDTLSENGLNNLKNKFYPLICFSIACETMPFDLPVFYKEHGLKMNFGESFTTGKDYGGPIYIGNTNKGITPSSALLEREIALKLVNGFHKFGEAHAYGKIEYNSYMGADITNYVAIAQNMLGDPSLELWTSVPQVYENITITRNDSSITVNGINGESTISYFSNDGGIGKRYASSSITLNHISPNSSFMLYGHNQIPFILPLQLQNISFNKSQYVIASDVTAGESIDISRPSGYVIVPEGVIYEIEASGTVRLEEGFIVEKGATFAVYPPCY